MQYEKISEKFKGHRVLCASAHDSATRFGRPIVFESEIIEFSPSLKYFKSIFSSQGYGIWSLVDDYVVIEDLGFKPIPSVEYRSCSKADLEVLNLKPPYSSDSDKIVITPLSNGGKISDPTKDSVKIHSGFTL